MCKEVVFLDLFKLQKKAVKAVKRSAKIFKKGAINIIEKGDAANIVTNADISIQHFLEKELKRIFPKAEFLGEEESSKIVTGEYLWVIDPIDGTTNFSRDIPHCLISVALLHKGQPVLGICFAPHLKQLFTAIAGSGAFCNGKRIKTSNKPFSNALLCTSFTPYRKDLARICADIVLEAYPLCNDTRRFGSCALEICNVAMGKCDMYFELNVFPWDCAAAVLILTEAGGYVSGYNGESLTFDKKNIVIGANNRENLEKLNSIILNHIKKPIDFEEL